MIGFIVPTLGRQTLARTIDSLIRQTNPEWRAVIVFDGMDPNYHLHDPRVTILQTPARLGEKNHAAHVRNYAATKIDCDWIGFVDDDDTLAEDYVDRALEAIHGDPDMDILIFRMQYESGRVVPPPGWYDFKMGEVGISFCLRQQIFLRFLFEPSGEEDFHLLDRCRAAGLKIVLSPRIEYFVRH